MPTVTLTPVAQPELCLDCYAISPDAMVGLSETEIADLEVWEGKVKSRLGDFFAVSGTAGKTPDETQIVINGDASRMKYIGYKMTGGKVTVKLLVPLLLFISLQVLELKRKTKHEFI